jgi:hypothetical protein
MGNNYSSTMDHIAKQEKYVNDNITKVRNNCKRQGMEYKYSDSQLKGKLREDYYRTSNTSTSNKYVLSDDWEKINSSRYS